MICLQYTLLIFLSLLPFSFASADSSAVEEVVEEVMESTEKAVKKKVDEEIEKRTDYKKNKDSDDETEKIKNKREDKKTGNKKDQETNAQITLVKEAGRQDNMVWKHRKPPDQRARNLIIRRKSLMKVETPGRTRDPAIRILKLKKLKRSGGSFGKIINYQAS